jgi:hypothetical protein
MCMQLFVDLGTNPSSDTPILLYIMMSILIHSAIYYFLPSSVAPLIKSYIVGTIHACISVFAVLIFFLYATINSTEVNRLMGGGLKGTIDELMTYIVCYSSGYFIYDAILKLRFKLIQHSSELIHHIIHILATISG